MVVSMSNQLMDVPNVWTAEQTFPCGFENQLPSFELQCKIKCFSYSNCEEYHNDYDDFLLRYEVLAFILPVHTEAVRRKV